MVPLIVSLLLLLANVAAACSPEDARDGAVSEAIDRADAALAALDADALGGATGALRRAVTCRATPITPDQAAHVHRIEGVQAFIQGDELDAATWFTASRALSPDAPLGSDLAGPLTATWERALSRTAPARRPLPAPRRGELVVDGTPQDSRPAHLPFVFQHVVDGRVAQATVHFPGEPLPVYPGATEPRRVRTALAVSAGASAVLSAAALVGAAEARRRFNTTDAHYDDVDHLVGVNRAFGVTGIALGAGAVGLGAVAAITWVR